MSRNAKIVLLVILALVFVAEAAVAAVIVLHRSKDHSSGSAGSTSQTNPVSKDACNIFTLADAKQVLHGDAAGGAMAATGSSKDVQVSGCSYKLSSTNASGINILSASLVEHRPKTEAGIASNQKIFNTQQAPGVQTVSGYGNKAFWDSQLGQFNVLKGNIWYVLTYGPAAPAERSLAQTKQLAGVLLPKL